MKAVLTGMSEAQFHRVKALLLGVFPDICVEDASGLIIPAAAVGTLDAKLAAGTEHCTAYAAEYQALCHMYGMKQNYLHADFTTSGGRRCRLMGLKRVNRRYPFITIDLRTGKCYKFTEEMVKNGLTKEGIIRA